MDELIGSLHGRDPAVATDSGRASPMQAALYAEFLAHVAKKRSRGLKIINSKNPSLTFIPTPG